MAIYHFSMSNVSRAKGSASTATLSYITGQRVEDERLGQTFYGFGRTERVEMTGVILPDEVPRRFSDPTVMMNEIELYEKSDRARPAKKIEMALPRELTREQQKEVVESFIRENLAAKGYGAVYAVHDDSEHHNPHCHVLIPNRQMNAQGWEQTKCRKEYALDEWGERIPVIDPKTGEQKVDGRNRKQWRRVNVEVNPLDQKATLKEMRECWARECNRYLSPDQQIDHRSLKDQGLSRIPMIHEGYAAREMESRGGLSERAEMNRQIKAGNGILEELLRLLRAIAEAIRALLAGREREEKDLKEKVYQAEAWVRSDPQAAILKEGIPRELEGESDLVRLVWRAVMKGKDPLEYVKTHMKTHKEHHRDDGERDDREDR